MYPIMSTGNTVSKAVAVLKEHKVKEENIILSNLFCTPIAVQTVLESFPRVIFLEFCLYYRFRKSPSRVL